MMMENVTVIIKRLSTLALIMTMRAIQQMMTGMEEKIIKIIMITACNCRKQQKL